MAYQSPIKTMFEEMKTVYLVLRIDYDNGRVVGRKYIGQLVRCEDCKWVDLCKDPEVYEYKGRNGFCSKGERKADG